MKPFTILVMVLAGAVAAAAGAGAAHADSVHTPSGRCIVLRVDIPAISIAGFDKDFVVRAHETCPSVPGDDDSHSPH